jgi:hypothetical protein
MPNNERTDTERLDWWLLHMQPDSIGDYDIWARMWADEATGDPPRDADYLRHARAAIDAAASSEAA